MSCCAAGPCDRYKHAWRMMGAWPLPEVRRRLREACGVCYAGDSKYHEQPETMLARTARMAREAEQRTHAKAYGLKVTRTPQMPEEEHYGAKQLRLQARVDPGSASRHRDGPARVPPSAWLSPQE